jgi:FdhD protein
VPRGPTQKTLAEGPGAEGWARRQVELIVEEPLEMRLDDRLVGTTMRTPGHDFELAAGFCWSEGWLEQAPVQAIRYCGTGSAVDTEFNVVSVDTAGRAPEPGPRIGVVSSACGLCGSDHIDEMVARVRPLDEVVTFRRDVAVGVPDAVRARQALFDRTGGVHAAAAFDEAGGLVVVREDIGRHNAVDKVVGRLLLDGMLPAGGLGLFVSGRASFEMVQKAWSAGFGTVVAVSAPSALAVEAAARGGLTLIGFARGGDLTIYTGMLR